MGKAPSGTCISRSIQFSFSWLCLREKCTLSPAPHPSIYFAQAHTHFTALSVQSRGGGTLAKSLQRVLLAGGLCCILCASPAQTPSDCAVLSLPAHPVPSKGQVIALLPSGEKRLVSDVSVLSRSKPPDLTERQAHPPAHETAFFKN